MLSLASSVLTIAVNVAYIADVLRHNLGAAALLVTLPYLLENVASVSMLTLSLFSKPIKTDERWSMFFVAVVTSNLFALLHFSGIVLVNPDRNPTISMAAQVASVALMPFYVMAVVTLGRQLTVMPEARKLVTRGPYSVSRHPLYVCYIAWFVLQIAIAQTLVIAALSTLMIVLLIVRARGEEALLASAFPAEYAAYSKRVGWIGRWTPRIFSGDAE